MLISLSHGFDLILWLSTGCRSGQQLKSKVLIRSNKPHFSVVYRKFVQTTVYFLNHLSSFLLKRPLILSFLVSSQKHPHSHSSHPVGGKINKTHTHTHNFHWLTFLPYTLQTAIHSCDSRKKKVFHWPVVFISLQIISSKWKRVLDLL